MFSDIRPTGKRGLGGDHRLRSVTLTFSIHKPNPNTPCAEDGILTLNQQQLTEGPPIATLVYSHIHR